jgi:DNA polymerase-1
MKDAETSEPIFNEDGDLIYDSGIPCSVCDDGRVRTSLYTTKVTGRWSSSRPSLQNVGKTVEERLFSVFGDDYRYPLRSIFRASPGCVFLEADYIGAEIASAAYMCNDARLLEHVRRNALPEDDPRYYDIHSNIAVQAFHLDCEPTKKGLKEIGKAYLRNLSKTFIFGLFYGRSLKAIAEGAQSEGYPVTEDDAAILKQTLDETYPKLLPYFDRCAARAGRPRWSANGLGRYRRFPTAMDREQLSSFERQMKNFPIQSLVADIVSRAAYLIYQRKNQMQLKTKIALQIHDALIFECPEDEVKVVYEQLIPETMVQGVPIYAADFDGKMLPDAVPRFLEVERELFYEWGVPIQEKERFGICS